MDSLVGKQLGKYQILNQIGSGGMARVYKAYQPGLNRFVAIKVLHDHLIAEENFLARFEQEATIIAHLRHPNILQVFDFEQQDGLYYMVMEYIEGPTLRQELDERRKTNPDSPPFTLNEAAVLLTALADALDYAHTRGMIHRDVKPGNVMFTADGQILLTDFGLSRIMGEGVRHTQAGGIAGTPGYMSPEQCRGEQVDGRSDIYALAVIAYELLTGRIPFEDEAVVTVILKHLTEPFPRLPYQSPVVNRIIQKASDKSPAGRYQTAAEMAASLRGAAGLPESFTPSVQLTANAHTSQSELIATGRSPSTDLTSLPNPYRGLYAFREEDSRFFFGRELFTTRLFKILQERAMVAVIGPSGSGKSSVVFAGLIPTLRNSGQWLIVHSRPGRSPFYSLATSLLPLLESPPNGHSETDQLIETQKLAAALQSNQVTLADVIQRILARHSEANQFLLVADQFEELFTLCNDPQQQKDYPNTLFEAVKVGGNHFSLAITLRADFVSQALAHRPFADALQDSDVKLGPMTRNELAQAIEYPARLFAVTFEAGLVDRILDDVGREPGNLPLLEFALTLLWERRTGRRLTHTAYETIGRVEGALAQYADKVYDNLKEQEQEQARRIFTQMVRPGEGTEDTRRVARRSELDPKDWSLANQLADARLVVTGQDPEGHETVEVVHEALIRGWGQLREWINADRTFRTWQERLRTALRQWQHSQQDEGGLLRGALLAEAQEWLIQRPADLSHEEQQFIQSSTNLRQRRQQEQEAQRQRELEAARRLAEEQQARANSEYRRAEEQARATRALSRLSWGLAFIFLLAVAAAIVANNQRQQAKNAESEAMVEANARATEVMIRSTAEADAIYNQNIAATRAIEAELERERADEESQSAMNAMLEAEQERDRADEQALLALTRQLAAQSINLSSDQLDLSLLLGLEAVKLNDIAESYGSVLTAMQLNPRLLTFLRAAGSLQEVAFSPDGQWLASAGENGELLLWDLATRQVHFRLEGHDPGLLVNSVSFTPDSRLLASASDDLTIRLWDVATGQSVGQPLRGHSGFVQVVVASPDPERPLLASGGGGGDHIIRLWDWTTGEQMGELVGHTLDVWDMAFSADGRWLASIAFDNTARVWEVASGREVFPSINLLNAPFRVAINSQAQLLATGDTAGQIELWDLNSGERIGQPLAAQVNTITGLVFSQDGRFLYSSSADNMIKIWEVVERALIPAGNPLIGHAGFIYGLDISPNGQLLAGGDTGGNLILWDVSPTLWPVIALQQLPQPTENDLYTTLDYSSDGRWLATGSTSAQLILKDLTTNQSYSLTHTSLITAPLTAMAFSPDNGLLASASANGTLLIWDVATGQPHLPQFNAAIHGVTAMTFSHDGRFLTTASRIGLGRIWDVASGQEGELLLFGHSGRITALAFSPDDQTLASIGEDGALILRLIGDVLNSNYEYLGQTLSHPLNSASSPTALAFDSEGGRLVTGNGQGDVVLWDVPGREAINQWTPQPGTPITAIAFADSDTLALASNEQIILFDLLNDTIEQTLPSGANSLTIDQGLLTAYQANGQATTWDWLGGTLISESAVGQGFTVRQGNVAASANEQGVITLLQAEDGTTFVNSLTITHTALFTAPITSLDFNRTSPILASAGQDGRVLLWDLATRQTIGDPLSDSINAIAELRFSPDGRLLAGAGCAALSNYGQCLAAEILIWHLESGEMSRLVGQTGSVQDLEWMPDSRHLLINGCAVAVDPISACLAGAIVIWDIATGQIEQTLTNFQTNVKAIAVGGDGRYLAVGDDNSDITLFDLTLPNPAGQRLALHSGPISSLDFSSDGQYLISGGLDGRLALWDVATGQAIGPGIFRHTGFVLGVMFRPGYPQVATIGQDNRLLIWDFDFNHWLTRACQVANRPLSPAEQAHYLPGLTLTPFCP